MKSADEDLLNLFFAGRNMAGSNRDCTAESWIAISNRNDTLECPSSQPTDIESDVNEMVRNHAAALSRFAATMLRDNSLVQDAVQEVFLRYFIARTGGQQMENPRAWLFRVLRNYLLDYNRKSGIMAAINLEDAVKVADIRQDVEAAYQQDEFLRSALSTLSPREKECILLRLEGFGYNEIAQILRIRPGTVAALLARGLKKFRQSGKMLGK
jgi:RNA polymerase sigma-70 factor, ECF subfamily